EPEAKDAAPAIRPVEEAEQAAEATGAGAQANANALPTQMTGGESASGGGERVQVVMPKMGESVMEGTVLSWAKQVGDTVEQDETLLEISTDKVDSEVPSPAAGVLVEILAPEGETVDVGAPIAVIATGAGASAGAAPAPAQPQAAAPPPAEKG